eukprot:2748103-Prymnesium_polylepis.5
MATPADPSLAGRCAATLASSSCRSSFATWHDVLLPLPCAKIHRAEAATTVEAAGVANRGSTAAVAATVVVSSAVVMSGKRAALDARPAQEGRA